MKIFLLFFFFIALGASLEGKLTLDLKAIEEGVVRTRREQDRNVSTPILFIITPVMTSRGLGGVTDPLLVGAAFAPHLTRLANTLRHVPRVWWLLVEQGKEDSSGIDKYLTYSNVWRTTHLKGGSDSSLQSLISLGLSYALHHSIRSVVHTAFMDNFYEVSTFLKMREVLSVGYLPIASLETTTHLSCEETLQNTWPSVENLVLKTSILSKISNGEGKKSISFTKSEIFLKRLGFSSPSSLPLLGGCSANRVWRMPLDSKAFTFPQGDSRATAENLLLGNLPRLHLYTSFQNI